jgi:hypothetical protein
LFGIRSVASRNGKLIVAENQRTGGEVFVFITITTGVLTADSGGHKVPPDIGSLG